MTIENLTIIGERINPGFASVRALFENGDIAGIQEVAEKQVNRGAGALDVNLGDKALEDPAFTAEVVRAIQEKVSVPLVFDSPSAKVQEIFLKAYDPGPAGGAAPIVNSVSELRWEIMDLLKIRPFRIILMASERQEGGKKIANHTLDEILDTARHLTQRVLEVGGGLTLDDLFIDVSVGPVGADTDGKTRMAVEAVKRVGSDAALKGIHQCVGLSNISAGLPQKTEAGLAVRPLMESAFLTLTVPHGLDAVIAAAGRDFRLLADDDPALVGFQEAILLDGYRTVMRIRDIYKNN